MFERRYAPRLSMGIPATVYTGQSEIACETRDLSRLGVAVITGSEALPSDRVLRITLSLTDTSPHVACDCVVAHRLEGEPPVWGLKFVNPPADLLVRLRGRASVAEPAARASREPPEAQTGSSNLAEEEPPAESREPVEGAGEPPKPATALREERDRDLKELYEEAVKSLK